MKDQRLVNTFLTGGAEEDESPRVRNSFLCIPMLSGVGRYSLNNAYRMKALKHGIKSLCDNILANVTLGLFSPFRFGISDYLSYNIEILRDRIRFLEVITNRDGEMGGMIPLWFDGAVCDFRELPKSSYYKDATQSDKQELEKIYRYCDALNNKQAVSSRPSTVLLLTTEKSRHIINFNKFY